MVELIQDKACIFSRAQIDDDEIQGFGNADFADIHPVSVKCHQDRMRIGASLVHPTAARRCCRLASVGVFHLASRRHLQIIDAIKRACDEDTDGGTRRKPLLYRQIGEVVVDFKSSHAIIGQDLVCHTGGVAKETAFFRFGEKRVLLHRQSIGPVARAIAQRRFQF